MEDECYWGVAVCKTCESHAIRQDLFGPQIDGRHCRCGAPMFGLRRFTLPHGKKLWTVRVPKGNGEWEEYETDEYPVCERLNNPGLSVSMNLPIPHVH